MSTSSPELNSRLSHSHFEQNAVTLNCIESSRCLIAGALLTPIAFCHGMVMGPVYGIKRIWGEFAVKTIRKEILAQGLTDNLNKKLSKQSRKNEFYTLAFKVALLHLIPVAGIPIAAAYLKHQTKTTYKGMAGAIEAYAHHFGKIFKNYILSSVVYPLRGMTEVQYKSTEGTTKQFVAYWKRRGSNVEKIDIPVNREDGKSHKIASVLFIPSKSTFNPKRPLIILFAGNMALGYEMFHWASRYIRMNYQVCMVTVGGYPGSDEGLLTKEKTVYQDANAVIQYLKGLGITKMGVHGLSIGGTVAFATAEMHPDVIKVVIADQTLSNIYHLASNLAYKSHDIQAAAHGIARAAMPSGKTVPGVYIGKGAKRKPYTTDGLDNVRKAKVLAQLENEGKHRCTVMALGALDDHIMSYGRKTPEGYEFNCAEDIMRARYNSQRPPSIHAGKHGNIEVMDKSLDVIRAVLETDLPPR